MSDTDSSAGSLVALDEADEMYKHQQQHHQHHQHQHSPQPAHPLTGAAAAAAADSGDGSVPRRSGTAVFRDKSEQRQAKKSTPNEPTFVESTVSSAAAETTPPRRRSIQSPTMQSQPQPQQQQSKPKHSSLPPEKRLPKIVEQEREARERAAQELLWMAPTDRDPSDGGGGGGGGSSTAGSTTTMTGTLSTSMMSSSGRLPDSLGGGGGGTGAGGGGAARPKSPAGAIDRHAASFEGPSASSPDMHQQQHHQPKRLPVQFVKHDASPVSMPRSMTSDSLSANSPGASRVAATTAAAAAATASGASPPTGAGTALNPLAGLAGRVRHGRNVSVEYYVRTQHGANPASVIFDSTQESMQLADTIGHGRSQSIGGGGGLTQQQQQQTSSSSTTQQQQQHVRSMSAGQGKGHSRPPSHARVLSRQGEMKILPQPMQQQQQLSAAGSASASGDFTSEQLANMEAFSGQHHQQQQQQQQQQSHSRGPSGAAAAAGSPQPSPQASPGAGARPAGHGRPASNARFYQRPVQQHPIRSSTVEDLTTMGAPTASSASSTAAARRASVQDPAAAAAAAAAARRSSIQQQHLRTDSGSSIQELDVTQRPSSAAAAAGAGAGAAAGGDDGDDDDHPHKEKKTVVRPPHRKRPSYAGSEVSEKTRSADAEEDAEDNVVYTGFGPRGQIEVPDIPYDHPWKQHTLPSLRFHINAFWTAVAMVVVAITCLPLGSVLLAHAHATKRVDVRYDQVSNYKHPRSFDTSSESGTGTWLWTTDIGTIRHRQGVSTMRRFTLHETLKAPIILSYGISNFYQNHLNVLQSKSYVQNAGLKTVSDIDTVNCNPLLTPGELKSTDEEKSANVRTYVDIDGVSNAKQYQDFNYLPCGSMPWSMFNDTFAIWQVPVGQHVANPDDVVSYAGTLTAMTTGGGAALFCNSSAFTADGTRTSSFTAAENPCHKRGITVRSDGARFKTPSFENNDGNLWVSTEHKSYVTNNVYLKNGWYVDEPGHAVPPLHDLDLQVWMRVAPLPRFRKILRVIDADMPPGQYQLEVNEYFDSISFHGEKFMSLEERAEFGGRNFGLPIVYLFTGGFALALFVATSCQWAVTRTPGAGADGDGGELVAEKAPVVVDADIAEGAADQSTADQSTAAQACE